MNIDYKYIVEFYSYAWEQYSIYRKITLNFMLIRLLTEKWNIPTEMDTHVLFVQSMERNDYSIFIKNIFDNLDIKEKKHIIINQRKEINFDFLNISFKEYSDIWKSINNYNIIKKIYIFLACVKIVSIKKYLNNYTLDLVVTHADMQQVENYIIQFFRLKNKKTATLQHGLYIDYSPEKTANELNYKAVVSEYFLAWGEETKKLINRYKENCKVLICGKPNKVIELVALKENYFIVVFDQESYKEYNKKLLKIAYDIAKKKNMKFFLKLHPKNMIEDYEINKKFIINEMDVSVAKFVLGHTTSILYELMRNGIPIFKYKTDMPSNSMNENMIFHNYAELLNIIFNLNTIDYEKEGKYYLKYIDKESLNIYNKTILRILNEKY